MYAIGLSQAGVPIDKIKICWNFLKYVSIQYQQKNGAVKTREVERYKIGESLQSNAKMWLKAFGYEDEADEYLKLLIDTNNIEVLPEEVQEKYVMSDCYVYVPLTKELIDKWENEIISTIKDIAMREKDYQNTESEMCFWDTDESVQSQSYYFSTLSGYSANLHKPYKAYLDRLDAAKNDVNVFDGVGSEVDDNVVMISNNMCDTDLSWLDNI